jgi:hypothetical protein
MRSGLQNMYGPDSFLIFLGVSSTTSFIIPLVRSYDTLVTLASEPL